MPIVHRRRSHAPGPLAALCRAALVSVAIGGVVAGMSAPALAATPLDAVAMPVGETLSGNFLAARSAIAAKDLAASAGYYAQALARDPADPFLLERAFTFALADGQVEAAMAYARDMAEIDPEHSFSNFALGISNFADNEWQPAIDHLMKGKADPLSGLVAEIIAAWAEAGMGRPEAGLKRIDALKGPEWYALFKNYHAGLIADFAGRSQEAVKRLAQAATYDRGSVRVTEAYVRALVRAGQGDTARDVIGEIMARAPSHPVLTELDAAVATGAAMTPLIERPQSGAAEILSGLGNAMARDDQSEVVAAYLQMALYLDPAIDVARLTLAELLSRADQHRRSIEVLAAVPETSPFKRTAEIQIGFDYNSLDEVDEAAAHLSRLLEADPSDLEAATALGNVLRVRKRFEEAADVYTTAIDAIEEPTSENWQLFYYRGIAFERTKRWNEAEADFRKALELQPDQALVLNYLGYSMVDRGERFDEALGMIERAVELEPADGYIVDSLGWVFYKLGRYEEAVEQLERAVELRPADATINDHLGDAYWKVGRRIEARFQWAHARDSNPEPEELPKILKKLEAGLPADAGPGNAQAETTRSGG
ncbi:tetratricopeptide repeat protein [Methylobrevis albus]|uniref:Tetratricopeptide repeat protein n=1 Tax=Methylobrevis albus TaxID=2793297 RepID=A0A931I2N2_9HYPH|nr:tetratricopeptide repeat protein [Methylobrevis albus]MBH0238141.1 tetratricopeptide repeat protein [Methylobrevis albus]